MSKKVGLVGGEELARRLKAAPDKISIAAVRKAGLVASRPMMEAAKRNAPDPSDIALDSRGRPKERTGRLQRFIGRGSRWIANEKQVSHFVGLIKVHKSRARKEGLTSTRINKKTGQSREVVNEPYYGRFVNDGTREQPAQHWLDKAFDDTADQFLDSYIPDIHKELDKVLKEK